MANIIERLFKRTTRDIPEERSLTASPTTAVGLPYGFSTSPLSVQSSMQLSTVYRCVDVIGDSIASQNWVVSEYSQADGWAVNEFHNIHYILNTEPNRYQSRYIFMKTLVSLALLQGNGYAKIIRDDRGDATAIELVTDSVSMFKRTDGSIYYEIQKYAKAVDRVEAEDMIHIVNFTYDGLTGVSTLFHAANSMGLYTAAEASAKGFFAGGANTSGILSVDGTLTQDKADAIKSSWASAFNVTSGTPGVVAVMQNGLTFSPVTVNPKDAQMLETRQFNNIDLCRFFGVPPVKVFASGEMPYTNVEAYQLGFITDTISPLDEKIESEFNRKVFRPSQRRVTKLTLDIKNLLRANMDAKANYLSKLFQIGGYTVNQVCAELGHPKVEGGDTVFIQSNMVPLNKPIEAEETKTRKR